LNHHGISESEWNVAKNEAKELLITRAKSKVNFLYSYSEIAAEIKTVQFYAHDQRLFDLLGDISMDEHSMERSLLSAIVVNKTGDKKPGHGFFDLAKSLGFDVTDKEKFWLDEIEKIRKSWS
jgi:hypothetical protein